VVFCSYWPCGLLLWASDDHAAGARRPAEGRNFLPRRSDDGAAEGLGRGGYRWSLVVLSLSGWRLGIPKLLFPTRLLQPVALTFRHVPRKIRLRLKILWVSQLTPEHSRVSQISQEMERL